jgi:hypothetical protein
VARKYRGRKKIYQGNEQSSETLLTPTIDKTIEEKNSQSLQASNNQLGSVGSIEYITYCLNVLIERVQKETRDSLKECECHYPCYCDCLCHCHVNATNINTFDTRWPPATGGTEEKPI